MFFLKEKINYTYLVLFILTILLVTINYINHAFIAIDTTIYTIIGKDIFNNLNMPYSATFDHKPILTYYIYGLLNFIIGQENLYFFVALLFCLVCAVILCKKNINDFFILSFFIIISSVLFDNFSGNSEMLLIPFISLYLLSYNSNYNYNYKFILIGGLASILFNINYLSAFIMMPLTIYMFFFNKTKTPFKNIIYFLIGFFFITILIFLPFIILNQSIFDYFNIQLEFLSKYTGDANRLTSILYLLKYILVFLPLIILFIFLSKKDSSFYLIITLFLGCIIGGFISDRGYSHYLEATVVPLSLMFLNITHKNKILALFLSFPIIISIIYFLPNREKEILYQDYVISAEGQKDILHLNKLAAIDNTALNIYSTHILYLFSDVKNVNKLIWPNHPIIFFGHEDKYYYINEINKKPHLIMTKPNMCDVPSEVCNLIEKNYHFDSTSKIQGGYDLYIRKNK